MRSTIRNAPIVIVAQVSLQMRILLIEFGRQVKVYGRHHRLDVSGIRAQSRSVSITVITQHDHQRILKIVFVAFQKVGHQRIGPGRLIQVVVCQFGCMFEKGAVC